MTDVLGRRKRRQGMIISDRMNKTVVVAVERRVKHRPYGKIVRQITNHKVHDENEEFRVGDTVEIIETRPISRTKRWRVLQRLSRGTDLGVSPADAIESIVEAEVMSSAGPSSDSVATAEVAEESSSEDAEVNDSVATAEVAEESSSEDGEVSDSVATAEVVEESSSEDVEEEGK